MLTELLLAVNNVNNDNDSNINRATIMEITHMNLCITTCISQPPTYVYLHLPSLSIDLLSIYFIYFDSVYPFFSSSFQATRNGSLISPILQPHIELIKG